MFSSRAYACSLFGFILVTSSCDGRTIFASDGAADVVSKYTTLPPTAQTPAPLDVYQQIANNIAERITSPIYRFLGYDGAMKPARAHLELVDETPEEVTKANVKPISNEIDSDRDVEELSAERLKKDDDTKPEKITLYSGYLPLEGAGKIIQNSTILNTNSTSSLPDDDDFDFDEFAESDSQSSSGGFLYVVELIGSLFTLICGAIKEYFRSGSS